MLFNSFDFAIFLPLVFFIYWFVTNKSLKLQNAFIVAASFLFYGWWDWRFLLLMVASASIDYVVGVQLDKEENKLKRKFLLFASMGANLGILCFFKYFNFFIENFNTAFSFLGYSLGYSSLRIVLPVGISFYTFQAMSYTIDVYKKDLKPTHSFIDYFAFISFFPQLVAGPIERATHLLPQFQRERHFDYAKAVDGLRQMLWGFFKKIVIADSCAEYANLIFDNPGAYNGSTLLLGALFFTFQIYGDFSGYSDIAIGTSRLFGFDIMRNFAFPYFSRDMAEFWRRWHISLSTWFRDYVYIPLGGSKGGLLKKVRNTFIIFLLSGLWHGANWTFIVWGALNALYFMPLLLLGKNRSNIDIVAQGRTLPTLREAAAMISTFTLTVLAWIFFRAEDMTHAFAYLGGIFSLSFFAVPQLLPKTVLLLIGVFILIEWNGRENTYAIQNVGFRWPRLVRLSLYTFLCFIVFCFAGTEQPFIYFQF